MKKEFELRVYHMRHATVNLLSNAMLEEDADTFATGVVKHPVDGDGSVLFDEQDMDGARRRVREACDAVIRNVEALGLQIVPVTTKARAALLVSEREG